jgi:hypothetical protein
MIRIYALAVQVHHDITMLQSSFPLTHIQTLCDTSRILCDGHTELYKNVIGLVNGAFGKMN